MNSIFVNKKNTKFFNILVAVMVLVWSNNLSVFSTENENVTASYFTNGISGGHNYDVKSGTGKYLVDDDTTNTLGVTWDENEQCAVFDGQSYYVIEHPLRGANANTGFTISMEVYISGSNNTSCSYYNSKGVSKTANGNQRLFDLSDGTIKKYFFFNAGSAGHLRISLTSNGRENKSDMTMINSNETYYDAWHTYTLVVAPGGNMTLYVDNESVSYKNADSTVVSVLNELANYRTFYLGTSIWETTGNSSDGFFIGKMRNVKFSVGTLDIPVFSTEDENITASYFTNGVSGGHNYQAEQGRTAYCVDSDTTNSLGVTWDENEQCAVFDGQAYYVIENPLRDANANTGFTISMEAYISSGNNASCYYYGSKGNSKKANGNQRLFDLSNGTTKKYFFMNAGSAGHLRISLTTNGREHKSDMIMDSDKTYYDEWHIYTLVVAPGGNMTLYVDGELVNHKVADSVVVNVLNELATYNTCYLGTSIYELTGSSDGFFIGKMRNVKFSVDNLIPPHDGSSCVYTGSSGLILNVPQNGSNKLILNASPNGSSDLILNVPQSASSDLLLNPLQNGSNNLILNTPQGGLNNLLLNPTQNGSSNLILNASPNGSSNLILNVPQSASSDLLLNPLQNSSNNLVLNSTQKVSSSLILHTGTKKQYGDVVNYVFENGTTSAIVKERGIIWLKEESIDHYDPVTGEPVITSSWYGLDNSSGTFEDGSVFWVRWINSDSDPEEWKKYYDMLDDEHKKWVENNKLWIFLTGVTGSDGKEYHILNANIPYYIQLGEDWDKNDIQALFISNNADEPIEYSYVDMEFPEGKGEFAKLILKHFSPYALYDKLQDNDFSKLLNESIFKDTGDTTFMMFYAYPLFCLVVLQRKKLLK